MEVLQDRRWERGRGEMDLQTEPPTAPSDQPGAHERPTHQVSRDGGGDECIRTIDQDPTDN